MLGTEGEGGPYHIIARSQLIHGPREWKLGARETSCPKRN